MHKDCIDISIVIPLYNSGQRIPLLYPSLSDILSSRNNYEIIFVDDGSVDNTPEIIKGIEEKDPHVRAIQFKKNKGQYEALFAGYKSSRGKIVLSLDDDAFEEINYIPKFIKKIEEGYDITLGWRDKRGYPILRRAASYLFNLVISLIISKRIHDIGSSLKARNRKTVDKLTSLGSLTPFLQYYKNYKVSELRISAYYSKKFNSRYSIIKLIKAASLILKNNIFNKNVQTGLCKELY